MWGFNSEYGLSHLYLTQKKKLKKNYKVDVVLFVNITFFLGVFIVTK